MTVEELSAVKDCGKHEHMSRKDSAVWFAAHCHECCSLLIVAVRLWERERCAKIAETLIIQIARTIREGK